MKSLKHVMNGIRSTTIEIGDIRQCCNIVDGFNEVLYLVIKSGISDGYFVKILSGERIYLETFWSSDVIGFDALIQRNRDWNKNAIDFNKLTKQMVIDYAKFLRKKIRVNKA